MPEPKKYRIIPLSRGAPEDGGKRADVIFASSMDPVEWKEFREKLMKMLKDGYSWWRFNLQGIGYPTSTDIGMWVTCNAAVSSHSGSVEFLIPKDSNVLKLLSLTKLDTIFMTTII